MPNLKGRWLSVLVPYSGISHASGHRRLSGREGVENGWNQEETSDTNGTLFEKFFAVHHIILWPPASNPFHPSVSFLYTYATRLLQILRIPTTIHLQSDPTTSPSPI